MSNMTESLPVISQERLNHEISTIVEPSRDFLPMPVQVKAIVARVAAVKEIVSQVFQNGNHFGEIPGTAKNKDGSAKLVLLKPGFDALCMAFQFAPEFIKQPETVESDKFINIVYKCRIVHSPTGRVIATGDGSCNSREEKYRWTTAARTCPKCQGEFIRTSKPEDQQGFYCWKKIGGCGATFPKRAPEIESQPEGRKENDNPWNYHNTFTKMAQKRAGMAAIITACGLSSDFTQDMEDFETGKPNPPAGFPDIEPIEINPVSGAQFSPPPPMEEFQQPQAQEEKTPDTDPEIWIESTPSEIVRDPDLERAKGDVRKECRKCFTKEDFKNLKTLMENKGGLYIDRRVTEIVNRVYAYRFPAPKTTKGV